MHISETNSRSLKKDRDDLRRIAFGAVRARRGIKFIFNVSRLLLLLALLPQLSAVLKMIVALGELEQHGRHLGLRCSSLSVQASLRYRSLIYVRLRSATESCSAGPVTHRERCHPIIKYINIRVSSMGPYSRCLVGWITNTETVCQVHVRVYA